MANRLITISASHYCEKARWALELAGIDYTEDAHASYFHKGVVRRAGGAGSVPVLVSGDFLLADSDAIVLWAAEQAEPHLQLMPAQAEAREAVLAWIERFNDDLGEEVRLWFFGAVIGNDRLLKKLAAHGVPLHERLLLPLIMPLAKKLIRKKRDLSPARLTLARERIEEAFDRVAAELTPASAFLVGNRLSLADIVFASLSSLALLPEGFGAWLPTPDDLPVEAAAQVGRWRAHAAGRFALRLYRDYRPA